MSKNRVGGMIRAGVPIVPQIQMMNKFKLELLRIIVTVVRQLMVLDLDAQEKLLTDLELVISTGDLSKLPPTIKLNV